MMRAIDAEEFECVTLKDCTDEFAEGAKYILKMIDKAPTLEVEPIRYAHWGVRPIKKGSPFSQYYCTECGRTSDKKYPYCHCGCKMEKED